MSHPYNAASFVHPNEVRVPQKLARALRPLPPLPTPGPSKLPYPSSSTSSLPPSPPPYEESGSLAEDPHKKSSISLSPVPPPSPLPANTSVPGPEAPRREYAHSAPLRPQRSPSFTRPPPPPPPPARTAKRDSDVRSIRSLGSVKFRQRITSLYRKRTNSTTTTTPDSPPVPPTPEPRQRDSGPVSEWVDGDSDDDEDYAEARARVSSRSGWKKAKKSPPSPWLTGSPPSAWPPTKPGVVIRHQGDEARRPAPVPYEQRPSERRSEDKKHDEWRKRMIDRFAL
ncbi:hypothetical protein B0H16DRAFT_218806 [Mycena metata]|uniref:Uncharacterized protein n=1 Tax=Mycena metata TaxID=1033252 RepID=A0AAD7NPU8_9AGAR|nr:hypothetical protein B0H16DRAFT_218806 [Mycena metata]